MGVHIFVFKEQYLNDFLIFFSTPVCRVKFKCCLFPYSCSVDLDTALKYVGHLRRFYKVTPLFS